MSLLSQNFWPKALLRGRCLEPRVSVILTSFNHRDFVADAIRSVLQQTLQDLELIIVDDGSLDGSVDIIRSFEGPRVQIHCMMENRRVHLRNFAIARASGHYVAFQNSDDVWEPTKLERQIEAFDNNRHSACFTGVAYIDELGAPKQTEWAFTTTERPSHEWLRYFFDFGNCLPLPSALVRRSELLAAGSFEASMVQVGDFDLWVRMAAKGDFRILPEPLTRIRITGSNLSANTPSHSRRSQLEISRLLHRFIEPGLLSLSGKIFPELSNIKTNAARKVALAQRAITNGKHGGYWHFADKVLASVLADEQEREEAAREIGSEFIRSFLEWRTRLQLSLAET
jgi:glycosyltransferase involved in cell wall biosynthesis